MPRRSMTLPDPVRRKLGDRLVEQRIYHMQQAEKRRADAHGLHARYRHQLQALRCEMREHARAAADTLELLETLGGAS
jgi:hypothetical protein